jgi:hypothetical protein
VVPGDGTKVWEKYISTRGESERRGKVRKWMDVPLQWCRLSARDGIGMHQGQLDHGKD